MGMVVLRSTTPCVAVNSRSNSNLLTVISIVPAATAASTGIKSVSLIQLTVLRNLGGMVLKTARLSAERQIAHLSRALRFQTIPATSGTTLYQIQNLLNQQ